jgi:hypothetical protein
MELGKIEPVAIGVALGILCGMSALFAGAIIILFNTKKIYSSILGSVTLNYDVAWTQCLFGALGVGLGAFLLSYIAAWFYNYLSNKIGM